VGRVIVQVKMGETYHNIAHASLSNEVLFTISIKIISVFK
jgi:hypothetical protein